MPSAPRICYRFGMYKDPDQRRAKAREQSLKNNARAPARKKALIERLGGGCYVCGYNRNSAALAVYLNGRPITSVDLRSEEAFEGVMALPIEQLRAVCCNCDQEERWPQHTLIIR